MKDIKKKNEEVSTHRVGEPRHIGETNEKIMNGNSPLTNGFQMWIAKQEGTVTKEDDEDELYKNIYPNTELGINLKLLTCEPGPMKNGELLSGAICRDGECHFTFIQNELEKNMHTQVKRNPYVLQLKYINVHRKDDGTLYPTFNHPHYTEKFTFQDFCRETAAELFRAAELL